MKAKQLLVFSCAGLLLASSPPQVYAVENVPSESSEELQKVRGFLSSIEEGDSASAVQSLAEFVKSLAVRLAASEEPEKTNESIDELIEHHHGRQEILNQMAALASTIDSGVTDNDEDILREKLAALRDEYKANTMKIFVSLLQSLGASKQDAERIAVRNPLMASIIAFIQTAGLGEFDPYL